MFEVASSERKSQQRARPEAKSAEPAYGPGSSKMGNRALTRHLGSGSPLPKATQSSMERSFGRSLGNVRVHTGSAAADAAERQNANAFTFGNHVVFGKGRYAPGTKRGDALLSHEVAHTLQQRQAGAAGTETVEEEAREAAARVEAKKQVGRLSPASPRVMRDKKAQTQEPPVLASELLLIVFASGQKGINTAAEMKLQVLHGPNGRPASTEVDPEVIEECRVSRLTDADGTVTFRFIHPALGRVLDMVAFSGDGTTWDQRFYWLPPASSDEGTGTGPGGRRTGKLTNKDNRQRAAEKTLKTGGFSTPSTIEETMSLYQRVAEQLPSSPDAEGGEDAVRFARFLQLNKDKIDGIIPPGEKGKGVTQEQVKKIIDLYGKFVVAAPLDKQAGPKAPDDPNNVFEYDPNWQKMSKQDRQLLIDAAKMSPEDLKKGKFETSKLTQTMKEEIALKLADGWASEVWEAAKAAASDPLFWVSLVLTIAIYIGLWLTPDPTFITKLAAGTLTAVMWAMFAWNDIWETITEYDAFGDNVKKARTAAELKAAGDRLGRKIGAVGFDILMMIATWGLGKAASAKLRASGANRGVSRAQGLRDLAVADPAAGVPKIAEGPAAKLFNEAKAPTASATLDALSPKLDVQAQKGLEILRKDIGDLSTYKALEAQSRSAPKGPGGKAEVLPKDLNHFLAEKAATPAAKTQAKASLLEAEAKLARAKLIQAEITGDPKLRKEARAAQMRDLVQRFKARLQDLGLLEKSEVKKAIQNHNVEDLRGMLGETIAREQLAAEPGNPEHSQVVSNLAVVKEVPGYETIDAWKNATNAKPGDVAKMFQGKGKIYQSLGEIDAMLVEEVRWAKPKARVIEEVKTGANDKPGAAKAQVTEKVLPALKKVAAGDPSVKVFELVGKKGLGAEKTGDFDFRGDIKAQTRGPAGKGFDKTLGFDPEVLDATAEALIKDGLPPAKAQTIPPVMDRKDTKDR